MKPLPSLAQEKAPAPPATDPPSDCLSVRDKREHCFHWMAVGNQEEVDAETRKAPAVTRRLQAEVIAVTVHLVGAAASLERH